MKRKLVAKAGARTVQTGTRPPTAGLSDVAQPKRTPRTFLYPNSEGHLSQSVNSFIF